MWKNIAETNIMVIAVFSFKATVYLQLFQVGTHADSLIGEALRKGVTGFDRELAWRALWKDATVPPAHDNNTM